MIRSEIQKLGALAPLPDEESATEEQLAELEDLILSITRPVTNEEARVLLTLFGPDGCYEVAWTVLHLIETAPNWPLWDSLDSEDNEWILRLRRRALKSTPE